MQMSRSKDRQVHNTRQHGQRERCDAVELRYADRDPPELLLLLRVRVVPQEPGPERAEEAGVIHDALPAADGEVGPEIVTVLGDEQSRVDARAHPLCDVVVQVEVAVPAGHVRDVDTPAVQSEVEVLKSVTRAESELKALQSSKAANCISASFVSAIKDEAGTGTDVTFGTPTATRVLPSTGAEKAFGFDIAIPFTSAGQNVTCYVAIRGFLVKHSEVTLTTGSLGTPFDMTTTEALLSKLVVRASTNAV